MTSSTCTQSERWTYEQRKTDRELDSYKTQMKMHIDDNKQKQKQIFRKVKDQERYRD